ncbi:hypothetical protein QYS48_29635 [Marivirga arenosa]|uniref:Uncharacterized protein n=1 Tax=Marivirga arenosa TaxID=3059076 RepID=A0AA51N7W7_9BACT|nr:hypothetical protein [Marivirga sp. ABR2-2]WMN07713.1 hypothetical protein QYS48_29635 [Marivirga sp. ABR2-2]
MNKYIFVLSIIVILYLSYSNYNLRKDTKIECNTSEIVKLNTDYELSIHKNFNKLENNFSLKGKIYDYDMNNYELQGSKLILRIPSNVCNPCYDQIYDLIKSNFSTFIDQNLIILVDVKTLREYRQYFMDLGMSDMVRGIKDDFLIGGGLENQPFPYLFMYNVNHNSYEYPFLVNKKFTGENSKIF